MEKAKRSIMSMSVIAFGFVFAVAVRAAEITKADNRDALSEPSSWTNGVAPGANDVAVWDGEVAVSGNWTNGLGADVVWQGIRGTNMIADLVITNSGHTLTLGADGIKLAIPNTAVNVRLHAPLSLAAAQEWLWNSSLSLHVYGPVSGTGPLTLSGSYYGALYNEVDVTGGVTVNCKGLYMRTNAVMAGPVEVQNGKNLWIDQPTDTDWSALFPDHVVANNGLLEFGAPTAAPRTTVTLEEGDSLNTTLTSDRNVGRITISKSDVVLSGGVITNNHLDLTGGTFTQDAGASFVNYVTAVGLGYTTTSSATDREATVSGGEMDTRRLSVGIGNTALYPGIFTVAGGHVKASREPDPRYGGIAIGATKESLINNNSITNPAGILRVTGGQLDASVISIGDYQIDRGLPAYDVTDGYARFELSGGEVNVGRGGIGTAPAWKSASSVYEMVWSGGTLGALMTNFSCQAKVTLSGRNGGVTVRTADKQGVSRTITLNETLSGAGGLRKTGGGTLVLAAECTYTGKTEVVEGTLKIDTTQTTAIWRADDLSEAPGTEISDWVCSSGDNSDWAFTYSVATAIYSGFTAPEVATDLMNGHKAVRFDGNMDALALSTATYTTPAYGGSNLTVAIVVRPRGPGKGSGTSANGVSGIIGSYIGWNATGSLWTLALSPSGSVGAGCCTNTAVVNFAGWSSVWDSTTNVVDSTPHVVMYTWQSGEVLEVNVDGQRTQFEGTLVDAAALVNTRMILGSNEAKLGFNGDIAEFRFYKGAPLSTADQDKVGRELAAVYGAVYTGAAEEDPEAEPEQASVPAAVAVWNPDGLSGTPGTPVTAWTSTTDARSFSSATASAVHPWATSPKIGTETINGYKTLYFDGGSNHLALTSTKNPVSGYTNMTVAVVLRPHGRGVGTSTDWKLNAFVVGQSFYSGVGQNWAVAYPANALLRGCVVTNDQNNNVTLWPSVEADVPLFYDNQAHVAIMTLKGGESVSINIDGAVKTTTNQIPAAAGIKATRILLGASEDGVNVFKGVIAEMRFWREALTLEQQRALGTELARKYDLPEDGYVFAQGPFASREVEVAAGAVFDAVYYCAQAGQVFRGGGDVNALLKLGADAVIESGPAAALTVQGLEVEAGGMLRWSCGADGAHAPTQVSGGVTLPQGTVLVEIDAANNVPRGVLLQYTGTLVDNGVVWEISGGGSTTKIVHDVENKRLQISTMTGTMLSVR